MNTEQSIEAIKEWEERGDTTKLGIPCYSQDIDKVKGLLGSIYDIEASDYFYGMALVYLTKKTGVDLINIL